MSERRSNPTTPRKVSSLAPADSPLRAKLHEIVFEAETPAGKLFDVALLLAIILSVVVVMLESVDQYRAAYGRLFWAIEVTLTLLFTVEYALRLYCVRRPLNYAWSFFGVVDMLAILPTYLTFLGLGMQALVVIRTLRLIRVFRVLELANYADEAALLAAALRRTQAKVVVFLTFVLTMVLITGSVMYLLEKDQPNTDFTNIPISVYWAIVTMTTVGYGDIAPQTAPGQFVAAIAMILGYSVIIVPMGIFSAEVVVARGRKVLTRNCPSCTLEGHEEDAIYCRRCGAEL